MPGLSNMGQDMDTYLIGFRVLIIYHFSRIVRPGIRFITWNGTADEKEKQIKWVSGRCRKTIYRASVRSESEKYWSCTFFAGLWTKPQASCFFSRRFCEHLTEMFSRHNGKRISTPPRNKKRKFVSGAPKEPFKIADQFSHAIRNYTELPI